MTSERRRLVSSIFASISGTLKKERVSEGDVRGEEGAVLESPPVFRGCVNCLNRCKFSLESGGLYDTLSDSCLEVSVDRDLTNVFIKCRCRGGWGDSFGSTSVDRDFTRLMKGFVLERVEDEALEGRMGDLEGEESGEEELVFCSERDDTLGELAKGPDEDKPGDRANGTVLNTCAAAGGGSSSFAVFSETGKMAGDTDSPSARMSWAPGPAGSWPPWGSRYRSSLASSPVTMLWSSSPSSRYSLNSSSSSSSSSPDAEKWMAIVSRDTDLCTCTLGVDGFGMSMVFSAWRPFRLVIAGFTRAQAL